MKLDEFYIVVDIQEFVKFLGKYLTMVTLTSNRTYSIMRILCQNPIMEFDRCFVCFLVFIFRLVSENLGVGHVRVSFLLLVEAVEPLSYTLIIELDQPAEFVTRFVDIAQNNFCKPMLCNLTSNWIFKF